MTRSKEDEKRRVGGRGERSSAVGVFGDRCLARALELGAGVGGWPDPRWQQDPVGFIRTILGWDPWEKQVEIAESVRDNSHTAVASCQKSGKSALAAGLALWFYSSFPRARVILTAVKLEQVDDVLWYEVRRQYADSGRCVTCKTAYPRGPRPCPHSKVVEGKIGVLARTGLEARDFRQVFGYTAQEAEGIGGLSTPEMFTVIDEASGVPRFVHETLDGNLGSASSMGRLLLLSNPTQNEGAFFDAFHDRKANYARIEISAFESPNVRAGREVIPGLASTEWVGKMASLYGTDSPFFRVRVEGKFLVKEQGKVLSLHQITQAIQRWEKTRPEGRLQVGVDIAGQTGAGDESVFVARRGEKVLDMRAVRGLTDEGHVVNIEGMLADHRQPKELVPPLVVLDRTGPIGAGVWGAVRAWATDREDVEVYPLMMSDKARRLQGYDRVRDEVWAMLAAWIREGGAIPDDPKLAAELHCPEWIQLPGGRDKVTGSDEMRRRLQRSPDRATALGCAVYNLGESELAVADHRVQSDPNEDAPPGELFDPYAGLDVWRR